MARLHSFKLDKDPTGCAEKDSDKLTRPVKLESGPKGLDCSSPEFDLGPLQELDDFLHELQFELNFYLTRH